MLNDCRRGDAQTSVQNAQRHPAMAAICHCICILQLAFNDYRMESKILRRVRYVMNILPSFSPYPSSSLPLTKTGKKGTARDNEQKKSKIMVAEPKASPRSGCPSRGGRQLGSPKRWRPHVPSCLMGGFCFAFFGRNGLAAHADNEQNPVFIGQSRISHIFSM